MQIKLHSDASTFMGKWDRTGIKTEWSREEGIIKKEQIIPFPFL